MIFVSLVTCLLGIGLYVFDLTSDIIFSLVMLQKRNESYNDTEYFDSFLNFPALKSDHPKCFADMNSAFNKKYNRTTDFDDFLSNNYFNFSSLKSDHQECFADMNSAFKKKYNKKSNNREDYGATAWISIWHCIQPFVVTVLVFITINYKRGCSGVKCSLPDIPDLPDCIDDSSVCERLNCLLCGIPFKVLWPLGYLGYLLVFWSSGLCPSFCCQIRSYSCPHPSLQILPGCKKSHQEEQT